MRVIRVFPRRTKATPPDGPLTYTGGPDFFAEADRIEISVSFSWDLPEADRLASVWSHVAPVEIGGPAGGTRGGEFAPGRYLKPGYVITSRGCPNKCWFCEAWKRDGPGRELVVQPGWNVLDDNLLACSEKHVRTVFAMLTRQPQRAAFTGGLEAARLADWHVDLLANLKPRPALFFACDTPDDYEPLAIAAVKVFSAGFTTASHRVRCYVLIGSPRDTLDAAEGRLQAVLQLGLTPAAMLYRGQNGSAPSKDWNHLARRWTRPAIIYATRGE